MKLNILYLLLAICTTMGCNNSPSATHKTENPGKTTQQKNEETDNKFDDPEIVAQIAKVKSEKVYTPEEMEAFFPEQLAGIDITDILSMPNHQSSVGKYTLNHNKKIEVHLSDGGGEHGETIIRHYMGVSKQTYKETNGNNYVRPVTEGGIKASESYREGSQKYEMAFFLPERFGIRFRSYGLNRDEAWEAIHAFIAHLKQNQ